MLRIPGTARSAHFSILVELGILNRLSTYNNTMIERTVPTDIRVGKSKARILSYLFIYYVYYSKTDISTFSALDKNNNHTLLAI